MNREIENAAQELSAARTRLEGQLEDLQNEITALEKRRLPAIRRAFEKASTLQDMFVQLIAENPGDFQRPKSVNLHGLKFGYRKGAGGIHFDDADQVIALIEKKLPEDLHDLLIKTRKSVLKVGLKQLAVSDLKKIGCTVEDTGDQVFVQSMDSALKKHIDRMLATNPETDDLKIAA